ncbi:MAG: RNA polymerase sigma factor [Blautia sp.]|nr:RNA polymerase sigma factor [Blautia sp.]
MSLNLRDTYDQLYRYCFFRLRSREASQDTVQEAFLRYIERYGPLGDGALPLLYTIARNLCIDYFRSEKGNMLPLEETEVSEEEESLLDQLIIKRALSRIPQEEAEILLLVMVNGLPMKDVGRILGLSRFAVYRRLQAGKKHFQGELLKEGLGDVW